MINAINSAPQILQIDENDVTCVRHRICRFLRALPYKLHTGVSCTGSLKFDEFDHIVLLVTT